MKITLNGSVFLSGGEEVYFEDLEVEIDEELPFDDIDDYYEENALDYNKEFYGDDEDIDENGDNPLNKLVDKYVEILEGGCTCKDCLTAILSGFVEEIIDL